MTTTTSAEREAQACPFCGGAATVGPTRSMYIVECNNANCAVNPDTLAIFKHEAITAWNRRAAMQASEPVNCECGACEWRDYYHGPLNTHKICASCGFKELLIAAPDRAPSQPTTGHMTETKANDIIERDGFGKVGYVMQKPGGDYCIVSQSAVRWLDSKQMWRLMHEQDGSLFADRVPSIDMSISAQKIDTSPERVDSVKPWQDRMGAHYAKGNVQCYSFEHFMAAEIDDWRKLGAPSIDGAAVAGKGCRDAFNLILNCRKLMSEKMDRADNWVIACELFAVGSTTAMAICREAGIDPRSMSMAKIAALQPEAQG